MTTTPPIPPVVSRPVNFKWPYAIPDKFLLAAKLEAKGFLVKSEWVTSGTKEVDCLIEELGKICPKAVPYLQQYFKDQEDYLSQQKKVENGAESPKSNAPLKRTAEAFFQQVKDTSPETYNHVREVTKLSAMLAVAHQQSGKEPKMSDQDVARLCLDAIVHDIGKLFIPDAIIHASALLTDEDYSNIVTKIDALGDLTSKRRFELIESVTQLKSLPHPPASGPTALLHNISYLVGIKDVDGRNLLTDEEVGRLERYADLLRKSEDVGATDNWEIMKHHTTIGKDLLEQLRLPEELATMPLDATAHHRMLDGTGYPEVPEGYKIPFHIQMLTVADQFEALIGPRSYKDGAPFNVAQNAVTEKAGTGELNIHVVELGNNGVFKNYMQNTRTHIDRKDLRVRSLQ